MNECDATPLLVVDDDPPIRKLLERVARRAGFAVDTAKDGIEALEMIRRKRYEIAIVDLMMPRLSGYDLVQNISVIQPHPCVIVVTALTDADIADIDDTMVKRVIRKPFDIEAVARTLIETARQLADQRALAGQGLTVAPPEVATLPIADRREEPAEPAHGDPEPPPPPDDELRKQ